MARRPSRKAILAYNATLQKALRLRDWRLGLEDGSPRGGNSTTVWATVWAATPLKREALLRYHDDLFDETPAVQREAFVHELIHLHLYEAYFVHHDAIRDNGKRLQNYQRTTYNYAEEKAVDALASVIAPRLPLPPWTRKRKKRKKSPPSTTPSSTREATPSGTRPAKTTSPITPGQAKDPPPPKGPPPLSAYTPRP